MPWQDTQDFADVEHSFIGRTPGIYWLRGVDLPVSKEVAAATWQSYVEHRGERPIAAFIYTHSHVDHFGGVAGIVSADDRDPTRLSPDRRASHRQP